MDELSPILLKPMVKPGCRLPAIHNTAAGGPDSLPGGPGIESPTEGRSIMALDTIDVTFARIVFNKPNKYNPTGLPFLIARTSSGQTVKGEMRSPREGERYRMWGHWAPQKGYDEPAFEFISYETLVDESVAGVVDYLRHYVPGLGLVKATAVVETLGLDTLKVLRTDPDRALVVPGITPAIVAGIREHFEEETTIDPVAYARLIDLFSRHKFPKRVVKSLLKDWGSDAPTKVISNPYMLLAYPRMGWKGVDAFAVETAKYDPQGLDRQVAAIVEGLERISDDGHTYGTRIEVERVAFTLLGKLPDDLAWNVATIDGLIVRLNDEDDWRDGTGERADDADEAFALPKLAYAERSIAGHLARLMGAGKPLGFRLDSPLLNDEQRAAMRVLEEHPVAILAGAPGVGKSWALAAAIGCFLKNRFGTIRLVGPTGKSAKRSQELIDAAVADHGIECSTIHRALGVAKSNDPEGVPSSVAKVGRGRDEFGFQHDERNPLEVDLIVCEELSMVDCRLMASLLSAVATGTRVIFVGDPNQLPSVGPGSVLRDLLASGVPAATLNTIQRSDGGGRVVRACHAIKDGCVPEPASQLRLPTENWVHIEEDDPGRIAGMIVEMHESAKRNGRYDPLWDMQVVSAQKKSHAFACEPLNAMLARVLNPGAYVASEGDESFAPPFRVGDKVIRKKNGTCDEMKIVGADGLDDDSREDWRWHDPRDGLSDGPRGYSLKETAIVNGDMGQVLDIVTGDKESFAVVRFRTPDRLCRLPMGEHHLIAAYALTCHSVQGSGFPYVIVPVHHAFYWDQKSGTGLFSRELVYTAISRAEKLLVTVGQFSAIRAAVGRKTVDFRRTRLAGYVEDVMAGLVAHDGPARRSEAVHAGRSDISPVILAFPSAGRGVAG